MQYDSRQSSRECCYLIMQPHYRALFKMRAATSSLRGAKCNNFTLRGERREKQCLAPTKPYIRLRRPLLMITLSSAHRLNTLSPSGKFETHFLPLFIEASTTRNSGIGIETRPRTGRLVVRIPDRGMRFISSPKLPDRLCCQPSLLFSE